jgi:hypothetical protein
LIGSQSLIESLISDMDNGGTAGLAVLGMGGIDTITQWQRSHSERSYSANFALSRSFLGKVLPSRQPD